MPTVDLNHEQAATTVDLSPETVEETAVLAVKQVPESATENAPQLGPKADPEQPIEDPLRSGYLWKSAGPLSIWRKRFFLLKEEGTPLEQFQGMVKKAASRGQQGDEWFNRIALASLSGSGFLFYYESNQSTDKPLGMVPLTEITDVVMVSGGKPFAFEVKTPSRDFHLRAGSEQELQAWLSLFRGAICQQPKNEEVAQVAESPVQESEGYKNALSEIKVSAAEQRSVLVKLKDSVKEQIGSKIKEDQALETAETAEKLPEAVEVSEEAAAPAAKTPFSLSKFLPHRDRKEEPLSLEDPSASSAEEKESGVPPTSEKTLFRKSFRGLKLFSFKKTPTAKEAEQATAETSAETTVESAVKTNEQVEKESAKHDESPGTNSAFARMHIMAGSFTRFIKKQPSPNITPAATPEPIAVAEVEEQVLETAQEEAIIPEILVEPATSVAGTDPASEPEVVQELTPQTASDIPSDIDEFARRDSRVTDRSLSRYSYPDDTLIYGWLEKQSDILKAWNRRMCVLTKDGELGYFRPSSDPKAGFVGSMQLVPDSVVVSQTSPSVLEGKFLFLVKCRDKKEYLLSAQSEKERSSWIEKIETAIQAAKASSASA